MKYAILVLGMVLATALLQAQQGNEKFTPPADRQWCDGLEVLPGVVFKPRMDTAAAAASLRSLGFIRTYSTVWAKQIGNIEIECDLDDDAPVVMFTCQSKYKKQLDALRAEFIKIYAKCGRRDEDPPRGSGPGLTSFLGKECERNFAPFVMVTRLGTIYREGEHNTERYHEFRVSYTTL